MIVSVVSGISTALVVFAAIRRSTMKYSMSRDLNTSWKTVYDLLKEPADYYKYGSGTGYNVRIDSRTEKEVKYMLLHDSSLGKLNTPVLRRFYPTAFDEKLHFFKCDFLMTYNFHAINNKQTNVEIAIEATGPWICTRLIYAGRGPFVKKLQFLEDYFFYKKPNNL